MWGRFRPLGRWRRTRTWRWCTPACRSPRGCTRAQSRRWWRWCGGAPSPELRRGSWTGRPRAPSALSPTPSWTSDPETPPGRRSPGPSSSPSCLRRWPWTRKGRSCCCWRRWSWRQRWRWAGWRRRWSVAGRPRWWRGRGGRGTRRPRRSLSPDLRESCRWAGGQPGWTPVALSPSGGWRYRSAGRTSRPPADRFPGKRRGEKEKVALAWPLDNAAICAGWEYGLTSEVKSIHPSVANLQLGGCQWVLAFCCDTLRPPACFSPCGFFSSPPPLVISVRKMKETIKKKERKVVPPAPC